jgi:hypothetical protein
VVKKGKQRRHNGNGRTYAGSPDGKIEFDYYTSHSFEITKKYRGKHIAIVGTRVAASANDAMTAWNTAKKLYPKSNPMLAYVPKHDLLVL